MATKPPTRSGTRTLAAVPPEPPAKTVSDSTAEQIISLYQAGERLIEITRQTGVPRATIYWVLRRNGIHPNRATKPSSESMSVHEVLDRLMASEREVATLQERLAVAQRTIEMLSGQLTQAGNGNVKVAPRTRKEAAK